MIVQKIKSSKRLRVEKYDSIVKRTHHSSGGPEFGSYNLCGVAESQLAVNPAVGDSTFF